MLAALLNGPLACLLRGNLFSDRLSARVPCESLRSYLLESKRGTFIYSFHLMKRMGPMVDSNLMNRKFYAGTFKHLGGTCHYPP